jgi:hypothetical protein
MKDTATIIKRALDVSDAHWRAWHRPDVCVAACRALQVAMKDVGITLEPIVARAKILNAPMYAAYISGDLDDQTPAQRKEWMDETGAWGVGLGFLDAKITLGFEPLPANNWGAHLALIEPAEGIFIDPTIGQASRPQKGITPPQSIVLSDSSEAFLSGEIEGGVSFGSTFALYKVYPKEDGLWLRSPDWREPMRHKTLVKKIHKTLRSA